MSDGECGQQFHQDMIRGAERLEREIGYNANRFMQMVGDLGGVGAARHLLQGRDASDGFTRLWEHGRLEMSVAAHVLLPWFRELFTEKQRGCASTGLASTRISPAPKESGQSGRWPGNDVIRRDEH